MEPCAPTEYPFELNTDSLNCVFPVRGQPFL